MLDIIEHIPRNEVDQIVPALYSALKRGGCLVSHTPLYNNDADLIHNINHNNTLFDSADEYKETKGMHINRYTRESLCKQFCKYNFVCYNDYIFLKSKNKIPIWKYNGRGKRFLARVLGYFFR